MMHMKKFPHENIAATLLGFVSLFNLAWACEEGKDENRVPLAVTPAPRLVSHDWMSLATWYRHHAEDVELAEKGEARIVFIGDSITEGWLWGEGKWWHGHFAPMGAVNFGIGGDMTQNLLWRLENGAVSNLDPEWVVCLIGTNNFGHSNEGPVEVALGIEAVVDQLCRVYPRAHVLLFAVFPRSAQADHPDRAKIRDLNQRIAHLGNRERVTLMDIGDRFLMPDGSIDAALMPDYLHLNEAGYDLWAEVILDWLRASGF
jgi:lysophospholipase L1-like esterase